MSLAFRCVSPLPLTRTWSGNAKHSLSKLQVSLARGCASPLPSGRSRTWSGHTGETLVVSLTLPSLPILPPWGHFSLSPSLPARKVLRPGAELSDFGGGKLSENPLFGRWPRLRGPPGVVSAKHNPDFIRSTLFRNRVAGKHPRKREKLSHRTSSSSLFPKNSRTKTRERLLSTVAVTRLEDDWFD